MVEVQAMELKKLKRERAVDAVYAALREAIITSLMKPGERMNVEELAGKLGVSLTPVRHAIQQLETEGLVEVKPRSGTFVANLSVQDIEDTFDIRYALERLAAERAVERVTPEIVGSLRDLLRLLRRPVKTSADRHAHERHNAELHQLLIQTSGNRRLEEMYDTLNAHIRIARIHGAETDWTGRAKVEAAEHEAIVDALEARNADALAEALRCHIYRAKESLVDALKVRQSKNGRDASA